MLKYSYLTGWFSPFPSSDLDCLGLKLDGIRYTVLGFWYSNVLGWTQTWLANNGYKQSLKRTSTVAGTSNADVGRNVHYLTNLSLRIELKVKQIKIYWINKIWIQCLTQQLLDFSIGSWTKNFNVFGQYKVK